MDALLSFAATLVALRLAAALAQRARAQRAPELAIWASALLAYAVAAGALAAGTAGEWHHSTFRVYYLFGGLLTAPLLGLGALLRLGWTRWIRATLSAYVGLAVGVALAAPIHGAIEASAIPRAQDHLDLFPTRVLAIAGNSLGTLAVVGVALATLRRRPRGNSLIVAGVATAAVGTAVSGIGEAGVAASIAVAACLLYAGAVLAR